MLHWAERIITQISQKSFDRKIERPQQIHERSVGAIWTAQIISTKSTTQLQQQQQSTSNSFTSFLSFEGHAYFYNTNNNDYKKNRSNCFFIWKKRTGFTMQNIEREETPD